jgi:hypothetical protein
MAPGSGHRNRGKLEDRIEQIGLETIKSPPLPFEGINHIQCSHCLPPRVFSVRNGITDDVFKEMTKDTADFFVDITTDSLDTASTSETSDCWLRNTLNVFTHHFSMPLGPTFSKTFATFASSGHLQNEPKRLGL